MDIYSFSLNLSFLYILFIFYSNFGCKYFNYTSAIDTNILMKQTNDSILFSNQATGKYNLCIITRVRNIGYLLPQWLEYHIISGIDHFFVADDCSNELQQNTLYWLEIYKKFGYITILYTNPYSICNNHIPDENKVINYTVLYAKQYCEWIFVTDPDEYIYPVSNYPIETSKSQSQYIPSYKSVYGFIKYHVKHLKLPVTRMPWYVMTTHGYEHRPQKLLIDAYTIGKFHGFIKTGIHSSLIIEWGNSHYPTKVQNVKNNLLIKLKIPFEGYVYNMWSHKTGPLIELLPPLRDANASYRPCHKPTISTLYIRHYRGLSFQDFTATRLQRRFMSNGEKSHFSPRHARNQWLELNSSNPNCQILPEGTFQNRISLALLHQSQVRLRYYRREILKTDMNRTGKTSLYYDLYDHLAWLNGYILE